MDALNKDCNIKPEKVDRVIMCSGKVFYELLTRRQDDQINNVAILRLEQLYPFPHDALKTELAKYPKVKDMGNITTVSEDQQSIEVIKASISQVFDAENVYDEADMSADDKSEFVESLTFPQIEKLSAFFLGMPKLQGKIEYKCNTCGKLNERVLEGLQSFF